jgi:octaprenyl-diphosphate synthase
MAFQIADDLFDYTAATPELGTEIGADLREGKLTLPLIHTLGHAAADEREWMVGVVQDPHFTADDFHRLVDRMRRLGSIRYAEETAEGFIAKAKAALAGFPDSAALATLHDIADYALHRRA